MGKGNRNWPREPDQEIGSDAEPDMVPDQAAPAMNALPERLSNAIKASRNLHAASHGILMQVEMRAGELSLALDRALTHDLPDDMRLSLTAIRERL